MILDRINQNKGSREAMKEKETKRSEVKRRKGAMPDRMKQNKGARGTEDTQETNDGTKDGRTLTGRKLTGRHLTRRQLAGRQLNGRK